MKRSVACLALVTLALTLPTAGRSASMRRAPIPPPNRTVTYTYKTFLTPQRFGQGPVGDLNEDFGTLKLTFNADGIISGTYRPEFGSLSMVSGGRDGKAFHISLGSRGQLTLQGHFTAHGISATASTFSPRGTYWQLYGDFVHA